MIWITACLLSATSVAWLRARLRRVPVDRG